MIKERARVTKAREQAKDNGRQAKAQEDPASIFTERGQEEYHRWRNGASTVRSNGTHGISSKVGTRDGHSNSNSNGLNNGLSNNSHKHRKRQRDHRESVLRDHNHG